MTPFEYLLGFAMVVLGLAVAELALGLSRLLRADRVRWDALAPLAAFLVFLKIVAQWWAWHAAEPLAPAMTFEIFLAVLASATLLFLLAATPFPDARDDGVDLRGQYDRTRRRFWILFALHSATAMAVSAWTQIVARDATLTFSPLYLLPFVAVALAFVRMRWVQLIGLAGFSLLYLAEYAGQRLS